MMAPFLAKLAGWFWGLWIQTNAKEERDQEARKDVRVSGRAQVQRCTQRTYSKVAARAASGSCKT